MHILCKLNSSREEVFVMKFASLTYSSALILLFSLSALAETPLSQYPHRSSYPDVSIMSTEQLTLERDKVEVIDVRSKFEFETLHIKNALNIPLTALDFEDKVSKVAKESSKPLVFYCNGKTCKKSYDAVRRAQRAKVDKMYAYDAGIFDWARANPDATTLLGKSPIKTSDLIDEDQFKSRLLSAKDFEAKVGAAAIVLDVRDRAQRDIALFPFGEERVSLDQKKALDEVIERAKTQKKTLLIYDKVGHQVQWLQYHLEDKGLKNYYFLKGGEEGYYEAKLGVTMGLKKTTIK